MLLTYCQTCFDHGKFEKSAGENEYGAPAHMAIEGFGAKHEDLAKNPRFSLMSRPVTAKPEVCFQTRQICRVQMLRVYITEPSRGFHW